MEKTAVLTSYENSNLVTVSNIRELQRVLIKKVSDVSKIQAVISWYKKASTNEEYDYGTGYIHVN